MTRDFAIAGFLLLLSAGAAASSNAVRKVKLPWVREPLPATPIADSTPATLVEGESVTSTPGASEEVKPGTIKIDAVLEHLSAGTAKFVDAREEREFVEGHLLGAINLPSSAIYKNIERVLGAASPVDKIIVYCGGGDCEASHHVADALRRDFSFSDVVIYENGWAEVMSSGRFNDHFATGAEP